MEFISSDGLRQQFCTAMSAMYRHEVPLYGELLDLVADVNQTALADAPAIKAQLQQINRLTSLAQERHGAIRLGRALELAQVRRLFALMGMYPVSYYDLSVAGIPVHSTAFRPVEADALAQNPFRIFTSLLRLELIKDELLRQQAQWILAAREIVSPTLLALIERAESDGGVSDSDVEPFIEEAVRVFSWREQALVEFELYQQLSEAHRLIADVVCFQGPHINHLTPSTLDIDAVQLAMPERQIAPKAVIEGPPKRACPILLRQTSFKALSEAVHFPTPDGAAQQGTHTARFGEIEQRGIALTPKGQALYDRLTAKVREQVTPLADGSNAQAYQHILTGVFTEFPDDYPTLREQQLAYFYYSVVDRESDPALGRGLTIDALIDRKLVRFDPIIYEDFLPISAAGIFQSNLGDTELAAAFDNSHQIEFERALGSPVFDRFMLYQRQQQQSIEDCLQFFNAGNN